MPSSPPVLVRGIGSTGNILILVTPVVRLDPRIGSGTSTTIVCRRTSLENIHRFPRSRTKFLAAGEWVA